MSTLYFRNALAVIAFMLPLTALADINGSVNLSSGSTLNLDTGKVVTSGGDISWNGTKLAIVGSATDADLTVATGGAYSGTSTFNTLTSQGSLLISQYAQTFGSALSNGAITPALNDILIVHTNGGNYSAVLVTSIAAGTIGLQYYTVESTGSGGGTTSNGPTVSAIVNNYGNIPAGLPSYGIAPASLFVIYGSNLSGPASALQLSNGAGLQTTVNQTSVSVTVNGTTVAPVLYYTSPTQIDAVLPSNTPVGTGTLTVTYNNNTSASATIVVTASAFGIDTLYGTGSGTIVATTGSGSIITPTNSAAPNETITIWGTGLGKDPASSNYATYPLALNNLNNATVYIGGVQASVSYAGRSQYPGVDQINVTVPSGLSGCGVSVVVVANGKDSNFGSLPINAGGGVCSDPTFGITGSELEQITTQTNVRTGSVVLIQSTAPSVAALAKSATFAAQNLSTSYYADASFTSYSGTTYASSSAFYSLGSCFVTETASSSTVTGTSTSNGLDAGSPIVLTGGGLNVQMPEQSFGGTSASGSYFATLTTPLIGGTAYTFTGPGGKDVGAFTAIVNFPNPLTWTNENAISTVTEAQGQQITWTGGANGTYVIITGDSTSTGASGSEPVSAGFTCLAPVSAGQFTVPAYVLLALPPGSGSLGIYNYSIGQSFTATGINYGTASAGVSSTEDVTYQ